jgi:hypothetical protein
MQKNIIYETSKSIRRYKVEFDEPYSGDRNDIEFFKFRDFLDWSSDKFDLEVYKNVRIK